MNRSTVSIALALLALLMAWLAMRAVSQTDPWYRNMDMNIHNTADAMAINSGQPPNLIDQPGMQLKLLLALDFRLRHYWGGLPVWNLETFGASADPIHELPALIKAGRIHSQILVLAVVLAAAALVWTVTRHLVTTCLAIILLSGSANFIFHGQLTRPELLCAGFGIILAPLCTWRSVAAATWPARYGWLFFAGLCIGFSALEKLPGVCYLALCYTWCWVGAYLDYKASPALAASPGFWRGLLPAAGAVATLILLFQLTRLPHEISTLSLLRLRIAAVCVALLPLLALSSPRGALWSFLRERSRELAVLLGGLLTALPLTYLLVRAVMPQARAADYLSRMIHYIFDPAPMMRILVDNPDVSQVFLQYVRLNPALFLCTPLLVAAVAWTRRIPIRLKLFTILLLLGALGMIYVMSGRHYTLHYAIFFEVPMLLVWALGLPALISCWLKKSPAALPARWAMPAVIGLAFVFALTLHPRLQTKYSHYQDDAILPVRELTLIFLFDHDAHTAAYRRIMQERYHSRPEFARTLENYLADPANRY